jgi:hypothetical protein
MRPERTISRAASHCGWVRTMKASCTLRPVRSRTSSREAASAALRAMGFSQSTCLPCSMARADQGTCRWLGSGLYTTSTSGSASSSS